MGDPWDVIAWTTQARPKLHPIDQGTREGPGMCSVQGAAPLSRRYRAGATREVGLAVAWVPLGGSGVGEGVRPEDPPRYTNPVGALHIKWVLPVNSPACAGRNEVLGTQCFLDNRILGRKRTEGSSVAQKNQHPTLGAGGTKHEGEGRPTEHWLLSS